jgi:hypothetical protein
MFSPAIQAIDFTNVFSDRSSYCCIAALPLDLLCIAPYQLRDPTIPPEAVANKRYEMTEQFKTGDDFQNVGKEGFDAAVRSYGEANKSFQAVIAEFTNYSKKAFEDGTRAFEQLVGAKSVEQAIEIQSQYVKKAYDAHIAQMTKFGEMYVSLARDAFKPIQDAAAKATKKFT